MNNIDVLGLGSVTVDLIGTVENWPAEGTKHLFRDFAVCDGGLIGTALTAVARLGGKAAFAGKLGYSEMAERAFESLSREGVDMSCVLRQKDAEPILVELLAAGVPPPPHRVRELSEKSW